jgi:hypothetical protein
MGPTLLFDKSFLQTLSEDEAVLLDQFFAAIIAPVFYVETLADLEKKARSRRSPDDEVRIIAKKIPLLHSAPMLFHPALAVRELLGGRVSMDGRLLLAGERTVTFRGRKGLIQDPGPEHEAFERWQERQFLPGERSTAKSWRQKLRRVDHSTLKAGVRAFGLLQRCRSLDEAHALSAKLVQTRDHQRELVRLAVIALGTGSRTQRAVLERWTSLGGPPLGAFAPYAAHILRVEAFFAIAHESSLISHNPNSRSDITYFHYAPFCKVFVSSDNLHARSANCFLRPNQTFVEGPYLKEALRQLVTRYLARPQAEQDNGLPSVPPTDDPGCLVSQLWDQHKGKEWREPPPNVPPEVVAAIEELIKTMKAEQIPTTEAADIADASSLEVNRMIPTYRGSFRLVPKHIAP